MTFNVENEEKLRTTPKKKKESLHIWTEDISSGMINYMATHCKLDWWILYPSRKPGNPSLSWMD